MHKKGVDMEPKTTLYHRKASGAVKVWTCWVAGCWVYSQWGQRGGQMNSTREVCHPKRGLPAAVIAVETYEKKVAKRMKRGYVDNLLSVVEDIRVDDDTIDFNKLPRSFAPAKPIKQIDMDTARELDMRGELFIQRKRDGMRHYLVSDTWGQTHIYSSGKEDVTEHLRPLVEGLKMPPRTILDVELVVTEPTKHNVCDYIKSRDGFLIVSGIARSKPERARSQIHLAERMGARVQLFAFDLLWWKGEPVYKKKYHYRYQKLQTAVDIALGDLHDKEFEGYDPLVRMPLVSISPTRLATLDEAYAMVGKYKWEGLVLWLKNKATVVQVNGTPKRVNCYKVKPVKEEDVVATGYELGKGKNHNVVGKFLIGCWEPFRKNYATSNAKMVRPMGRCGTGLDDATRKAALKWKYPCVIQIEYDQKSEKGFRFPVFIRKRDDKKVEDCVG